MIASYGSNNGFGWKPGTDRRGTNRFSADVIACTECQAGVSSADRLPGQHARYHHHRPGCRSLLHRDSAAKVLSDTADRASKGETNQAVLPVKGNDEIATVTASFNRMQVSLAKAFKMLQ